MKKLKAFLCIALSVLMLCAILPASVLADEPVEKSGTEDVEEESSPEGTLQSADGIDAVGSEKKIVDETSDSPKTGSITIKFTMEGLGEIAAESIPVRLDILILETQKNSAQACFNVTKKENVYYGEYTAENIALVKCKVSDYTTIDGYVRTSGEPVAVTLTAEEPNATVEIKSVYAPAPLELQEVKSKDINESNNTPVKELKEIREADKEAANLTNNDNGNNEQQGDDKQKQQDQQLKELDTSKIINVSEEEKEIVNKEGEGLEKEPISENKEEPKFYTVTVTKKVTGSNTDPGDEFVFGINYSNQQIEEALQQEEAVAKRAMVASINSYAELDTGNIDNRQINEKVIREIEEKPPIVTNAYHFEEFTLKAGESKTFNVYENTNVEVAEINCGNYSLNKIYINGNEALLDPNKSRGVKINEVNAAQSIVFENTRSADNKRVDITIKKVDENGNPLPGARFELALIEEWPEARPDDERLRKMSVRKESNEKVPPERILPLFPSENRLYYAESDANGIVTFKDVNKGHRYVLSEVAAPYGYNRKDLQEKYIFEIDKNGIVYLADKNDSTPTVYNGDLTIENEKANYTVKNMILISVPFVKKVEKNGTYEPGAETFRFRIAGFASQALTTSSVKIDNCTITTNGAGTYNGTLSFYVPDAELADQALEGFWVVEEKGTAAGWEYSNEVYFVGVLPEKIKDDIIVQKKQMKAKKQVAEDKLLQEENLERDIIKQLPDKELVQEPNFVFYKVGKVGERPMEEYKVDRVEFTNTYTYTYTYTPVTYPDYNRPVFNHTRNEPATPVAPQILPPQTGDRELNVAAILMVAMAAAMVCVAVSRRKHD